MNHPRWRLLRCVPLGLLAVVLWREKPWTIQLSASAPWAVAATILLNLAVNLPLKAARWQVVLTDPPPFRAVLAATIEGLLASAAIGFGSGDLVRAARLRGTGAPGQASPPEGHASPPEGQASPPEGQLAVDYGCTWAERGAEVLALAILIFVTARATGLGTLAVAISGLVMVGYAALLGAGHWVVSRLARWPGVERGLSSGLRASTPRRVAAMIGLSLLGWSSELIMLVLFQRAFHLEPSLRAALLTLVGINAAIAIPTLTGNFGTFEAGAAAALVMCGAPRAVAVSYALTYHLTHVIPVAAVATAVYLMRSSGRSGGRSGSRSGSRRYRTTPARTSTGR